MARVQDGLVLLVVLMVCLRGVAAELNCQAEAKYRDINELCFLQNGLESVLPLLSQSNKDDSEGNYITTVVGRDKQLLCSSRRDNVKKALKCTLSSEIRCLPEDNKGYVTRPENIDKIVDILCSETEKVDLECVKGKARALLNCGKEKGAQLSALGVLNVSITIVCQVFQLNAECIRAELTSCGCSTVKAYQTVTLDLMYPPACPAFKSTRVQCDEANPQLYQGNGGQRNTGWPVSFFVSCILVFIYSILANSYVITNATDIQNSSRLSCS